MILVSMIKHIWQRPRFIALEQLNPSAGKADYSAFKNWWQISRTPLPPALEALKIKDPDLFYSFCFRPYLQRFDVFCHAGCDSSQFESLEASLSTDCFVSVLDDGYWIIPNDFRQALSEWYLWRNDCRACQYDDLASPALFGVIQFLVKTPKNLSIRI